jgi:hypothetical protein
LCFSSILLLPLRFQEYSELFKIQGSWECLFCMAFVAWSS